MSLAVESRTKALDVVTQFYRDIRERDSALTIDPLRTRTTRREGYVAPYCGVGCDARRACEG